MFSIVHVPRDLLVMVWKAVNPFHRRATSKITAAWMLNAYPQVIINMNVLVIRAFTVTASFVCQKSIVWMCRNYAMSKDVVFTQHLDINVFVMQVSDTWLWKVLNFEVLFCMENFSGFIGNGTYCTEPFRQEHAFLLLSQGVAIVKFPLNGNRGSPIAMAGVRRKLHVFPLNLRIDFNVDLLCFQF